MGPGVANLLGIYQAFSGWDDGQMRAHFAGMRYGDLKKQVAEMVISHLEPFQQRYREIVADPGYVQGVLREGAERVTPIANSTVESGEEAHGSLHRSPDMGSLARIRPAGAREPEFPALLARADRQRDRRLVLFARRL